MLISKESKRSLPRLIQEFADRKVAFGLFIFLYVVVSFGLAKQSNLWLYFLPAILGAVLATLVYTLVPYNPYQNLFARKEGKAELEIENDPAVQRMLTLLRSKPARIVAMRTGLYTIVGLCLPMLIVILFNSKRPSEEFGLEQVSWLAIFTWFFLIISIGIQIHFLLRWSIKRLTQDKHADGS